MTNGLAAHDLSPNDLINAELVDLDVAGADRYEVTRGLAARMEKTGRVTDLETFLGDVRAREEQMPTGLEGGIGIPHARSAAVSAATLAFARSANGVDWGAPDGPAHLIFLIAAPAGGGSEHMTILAALARRLVRPAFKQALHDATSPDDVVALINKEVLGR
ncbi:MAG: fructose system component [Frankiaceae bacterium]|jgi:PTS system fructose-specific IIA component|nr:fructose system component [Frankiaceae bacterium]